MNLKETIKSTLFVYETPKLVMIESKFIGILHKLTLFSLLVMIVIWVFILNNGYQSVDNGATGGTTTKLKGVATSNSTDPRIGKAIWDTIDLNIPPRENGALFLTTNIILTHNQTQSTCPDVEWSTKCHKDEDCLPPGEPYHLGHGTSTGVCNTATNSCNVHAWCPIEDDSPPKNEHGAALKHTANFTLMIKNYVYFPLFNKSRSNIIESITKKKLRSCRYHPTNDPYCPIFRVGDIVDIAESQALTEDDKNFEAMAVRGGVISVSIKWDCNFDYDESHCKPSYMFKRLDNSHHYKASNGYNFRYPLTYTDEGVRRRSLVKAYGILFLIKIEAKARAFEISTFILNIGSAVGILGIASIVSEIVLLHIHRNKESFRKSKVDPKVTTKQVKMIKTKFQAMRAFNNNALISKQSTKEAVDKNLMRDEGEAAGLD